MKIYNCFRRDPTNAGDWHSPPFRYFPEFGDLTLDITSNEVPSERSVVICGGGGLISPKKGFQKIRRFLGHHICIGWGLGENWYDNKDLGYHPPGPQTFPDYLDDFDLLGIRDVSQKYDQVACASCLHPAFDQSYEIKRTVGIYMHKRIPLASYGHDSFSNDGASIEEKVRFLGESEVIVTNSYHGAYWGMLLNRRIICVPFGSKFYGFGESIEHRTPWGINLDNIADLPRHPSYLERCRGQNIKFKNAVSLYLKQHAGL